LQLKYCFLQEADDPEDLSAWPGDGPCIVKPADSRGGGSRGVKVVDKPDQFAEAVAFARSFYADKRVMLEECVRGTEHSMELLGHDGEVHVLCVGDKVKTPYPYRVDAAVVYPTKLSGERLEQAVQAAKTGALALGLETFAAHVELAMTKEGPRLFELGARFGGGHTASHILPHVTGRKFLQDYVRLLLGQKIDIAPARFSKGCVYRFIMPKPGVVARVTGLEEVSRMEGVLDAAVFFGPGTTIPPVKTGLDRAGFIVTGMNSREEALELSLKAEAMIQFHYL
jgi:biotin carboxylase